MPRLYDSHYFTEEECACNCGCGKMIVSDTLLRRLERARTNAGIPFKVTSWTRCKHHNEASGAKGPEHTVGEAVDVEADDSLERFTIVSEGIKAGFTRIGISKAGNFVHFGVSTDLPNPRLWLY